MIGDTWLVVSNISYVHPYLGKISNLTHIVQMGWFNHQPDKYPGHPVIFSADEWGVQSLSQHSIEVPLPFSDG